MKNRTDGTWAINWKSIRKGGDWIRVVKARLTARGFKDAHACKDELQTYSGTATAWSQRAANAHAAQGNYTLFSMDISAAFLKGLMFEEITT